MADTDILSQVPGMNGFLSSGSLADKSADDLPLDIFSFGRIVLYTTTRQWPQPTPTINCDSATDNRSMLTEGYEQYLDKMAESYMNLKPLVMSCLDDKPQSRPSAAQASMEVKKVKIAYTQKLCFTIWGTEDPQSIVELQRVQKPLYQQQTYHQLETQEMEELNQQQQQQQQEVEEEMHQLVMQQQIQSLQTVPREQRLEHMEETSQDDDKPLDVDTQETSEVELIYPLYIAKYDYASRSDNEMSFKRGDQFFIINNDNKDWWYARAKHSGEEGHVPNNYVTKSPIDAEDWFFGDISRAGAEELLMQPSADHGSFLICNSEKRSGEYSLSIRYLDKVKHCEIYRVGRSVYLSPKQSFPSISELIVYYNKEILPTANNQQVRLKKICPHVSKTSSTSREGDGWETDRETVCLVKKIETGKYSEVWEGIWNDTTSVAVKTSMLDSTDIERLYKEMEILKQLSHPNMIELYAVCTKEEPIYIITELTKHGNLLEYIRSEGRSVSLPQVINMMAQIATGMAYLGEKNYIHQDLAARNVMLADGLVCKLADFSSVQAITAGIYEPHAGIKLPIKWTALEVILYSYFTIKSDVWSFGVLMYELITRGRLPYPGMTNAQVVQALKTGYRMPSPKGCPEQLYDIMTECWRDDAATRPTFEVLQSKLEELSSNTEHLQLLSNQLVSDDSTEDEEEEIDDLSLTEETKDNIAEEENDNDDYEMISDELFNTSDCPVFVAKYDYVQRTDEDLSFKKGDLLYIINSDDQDWWLAKNSSDRKGFIPSNHVVDYRSLEAQKWYFGETGRKEAEELLMYKTNTSGSFLIRDSISSSSGYSLSVRNAETVTHYKINRSDKGRFHIVPCIVFESILDLVTYYGRQSDGLCANLMYPCSTGEKPQVIGESEKPEDMEVDKESVKLSKKLGVGRFGEVWQAMWNNTTPVAVKMLNVGSTGLHDFLKAAVLLKQLTHPKLIQIYAVSTKEVPIYIIMELMKYGSLLEYLKSERSSLKLPQLIDIGVQVAAGMAHLEEKNCIHRDISAKNIYVTVNHICKVAGLSITRVSESAIESHNRGMSPVKWTAPEALMHGCFTIKSDVWSFGILLYELITYGQAPYPEMNNAQVIEELQNDYRMPCPEDCPEELYEIMTECWSSDPPSRPTFETVLYKLENFFMDPKNKHLCPDQNWQLDEEGLKQQKYGQDEQQQKDQQELIEQELQQERQDKLEQQFEDRQQLGGQPPEEIVTNIAPSPAMSSSGNPTPPPQLAKATSITSFKSLKDEKELQDKNKNVLSRTKTFPNIAAEDIAGDKLSISNDVVNKESSNASNHPLFVGKFDYLSRTNNDLGFKKGDLLYILSTDDKDWWLASNTSGKEGYIPSNHVAIFGALNAEDWYFGAITRFQADKLLMHTTNEDGSFLVRDSERASGGYSLSVKNAEEVIHYRVQRTEGTGYFVGQNSSFQTLPGLIVHYKKQQDGLCASLSVPCFVEKPQTAGLSRETNKAWDLDRKSIHLMKKLGAGQFGEVWDAMWNNTIEVAVKTLKPGIMGVNEFLEKAALMRKLRHPKLVQVYAVCTKEKPIYLMSEFMKHGSLLDNLRGSGRSLELRHLIDIGSQVAAGMAYLEEKNYVHRNLAARNVMMSGRLTCKIADYGLTRNDDTCEDNTGAKFMVKWTAPEAALYNKFSTKSDVWSFGILLYELISYGRFPYPGMNNAQVLEALQTGYRMPCPTCCPEHLYNIMLDCWKNDTTARPKFNTLQCKMEEFFTETVHTDLFPNQVTNT